MVALSSPGEERKGFYCPICKRLVEVEIIPPAQTTSCPLCGGLIWEGNQPDSILSREERRKITIKGLIGLELFAVIILVGRTVGIGVTEILILAVIGVLLFAGDLVKFARLWGRTSHY
ncbi:MAG: hypothetical protein EXR99_07395 [Gemmataceae bacterium]|nr:hypothetical protein [Gemmataceae bacterium]